MSTVHRKFEILVDNEHLPLMERSQHRPPHFGSHFLHGKIASELLAEVEAADIFRIEQPKEYPRFDTNEIITGRVLGKGSTGVVKEILLIVDPLLDGCDESEREKRDDTDGGTKSSEIHHNIRCMDQCFNESMIDRFHYHFSLAKHIMHRRCLREGEARYAVKSLNVGTLKGEELFQAQIDLAIEIKFLQALSHPNIVRLRGLKKTDDRVDPTNFFIMDRLV